MEKLSNLFKPKKTVPQFQQKGILKEGYLIKRDKNMKKWKKRYVILTDTHLLTYKVRDGNFQAASIIIPLNNDCTIKSADDELNIKYSFQVVTKDRTVYFQCADNDS